uniref:Uncharacterized protein n=1 Tax=Entomoneis paludosa TaxID=265537 RepID=A0A7S2Y365_9STRA
MTIMEQQEFSAEPHLEPLRHQATHDNCFALAMALLLGQNDDVMVCRDVGSFLLGTRRWTPRCFFHNPAVQLASMHDQPGRIPTNSMVSPFQDKQPSASKVRSSPSRRNYKGSPAAVLRGQAEKKGEDGPCRDGTFRKHGSFFLFATEESSS